jgi:hypothetical protein
MIRFVEADILLFTIMLLSPLGERNMNMRMRMRMRMRRDHKEAVNDPR